MTQLKGTHSRDLTEVLSTDGVCVLATPGQEGLLRAREKRTVSSNDR